MRVADTVAVVDVVVHVTRIAVVVDYDDDDGNCHTCDDADQCRYVVVVVVDVETQVQPTAATTLAW